MARAGGQGVPSRARQRARYRRRDARAHMAGLLLPGDTLPPPPASGHATPPHPVVTNPNVRWGLLHRLILSPTRRWNTEWLPMSRPAPVRVSCGLPGAFLRHRLIGHPGAVAGCCRPARGCSGSVPRLGTAATGCPSLQQFQIQSNLFQSIQTILGCSELS